MSVFDQMEYLKVIAEQVDDGYVIFKCQIPVIMYEWYLNHLKQYGEPPNQQWLDDELSKFGVDIKKSLTNTKH